MSDSKPRSFWGRVTEFVKNPTQDWSLTRHENALRELKEQEQVRAKEEQRKLDAFIRRRELASLRRLRKRQADGLPIDDAYTDLPDTGTGTGPSAPEREATLRKINEIEQAMVDDAKPGGAAAPRGKSGANSRLKNEAQDVAPDNVIRIGGAADAAPATQTANGQPHALPSTDQGLLGASGGASGQPGMQGGIAPTVAMPTELAPTQMAATQAAATVMGMTLFATEHPPMDTWMKTGGYVSSGPMAVDVQEGVSSSPLFDQACIDFANGHDEAAERALLDAISGSPERDLENEFWLALFDLYRAGNDATKFEALVADYVERFQSSAPSWDGPTGHKHPSSAAPAPHAASALAHAPSATGPAAFTALGELDAAQSRSLLLLARSGARQVTLDFTALTSMAPGAQTFAVEALKTLNAAAGCVIELVGVGSLLEACAAAAPPMQRNADPAWWGLRLEALRLAGEQDAFENVALDYCVTYEISPPTWEPSRAKVHTVWGDAAGPFGNPPSLLSQGHVSSLFNTHFGNTGAGVAFASLSGEIQGGSEEFLKPLDAAASGQAGVVVNLAGLRRLDFASAGIMLNWVMTQSSAGRSVQFQNTHRLIAGLFVILGINSVAQIDLRKF
jgi:anti-anti-sigma regulatory factor